MRLTLLITLIIFVGLELRVPISYLPTMAEEVINSLHISTYLFSFLTSIYPLCFFFISPLVPWLEKKISLNKIITLSMTVSIVAYMLRLEQSVPILIASTFLFGFSISLGNISLPSFIKRQSENKISLLSSLYTASLYLGPALATSLTIPIKNHLNLSWNTVPLFWMCIPIIALIVIGIFTMKEDKKEKIKDVLSIREIQNDSSNPKNITPVKNIFCYSMALYFGILSGIFFIVTAWMPTIIISFGFNHETAALYSSLFTYSAIPFSILTSYIIYKTKKQWIYFVFSPLIVLFGVANMIYWKDHLPLFLIIMGIGSGICTGVAFITPLLRFKNPFNVTKTNAMMQSIGYLIAFISPILSSFIFEKTAQWDDVLWLILAALAVQTLIGIPLGKKQYLDNE
ncbi:membrane protein of unknown function [Xenorhabdus poinarii G6]|uniref:MFS transporter n=1 Tax=Xenorhabdus poinarii G6 TaxID=1354304 RepID=A0A068R878_9GAMM|nr:MFS transporter [Xenorhabdus poinarii]CDG23194.1 membrane protein of unknown function [Xenorhabdus poinarii G6]